MTKHERFGVLMQMLSETYHRPLSPLMLEGYWSALQGYDDAVLAHAVKRAIGICKYMPTPADIRESVREVKANRVLGTTDRMLEGKRGWTPPTPEQMEEIRAIRKQARSLADVKS